METEQIQKENAMTEETKSTGNERPRKVIQRGGGDAVYCLAGLPGLRADEVFGDVKLLA